MRRVILPQIVRWSLGAIVVCALSTALALAPVKTHPPLVELPRDEVAQLAPLLRSGDFALLESDARGWERQVTTISLARAAPAAVREIVIHPERYEAFCRNMRGREVKQNPDGTYDHTWKLSYGIVSFSGVNRYRLLPAREGEPAGAVEITDPTGMSTYRWEFLPSAHGGGTIVVVYGYTDVRHSGGLIDKILARADTLEHGLALITQMTLHRAMVVEAEKRPGSVEPYKAPAAGSKATSYKFLLDRGALAILRHQNGRLVDFSLIDRSSAAAGALADELAHPERWAYVPSFKKVAAHEPRDGLSVVEIEQSLPLLSWDTYFGVRAAPNGNPGGNNVGVDLFGLQGDLSASRMRFDLVPDGTLQQIVLRGQLAYDRSSTVMRQLFRLEPLFEDGVNVGLTFIILRAVRAHLEHGASR
jgi:hypothetical protein